LTVDVKFKLEEDNVVECRSVVSFYPRFAAFGEPSYSILEIDGDMEALKIVNLRSSHVVLLCRNYNRTSTPSDNIPNEEKSVYAIVVSLPDRVEIGRMVLVEEVGLDLYEIPEISIVNDGTIGVGLSWKGVVMTGSAVRSLAAPSDSVKVEDAASSRTTKRKKNKRLGNKGSKKDAFSRGMTLRG